VAANAALTFFMPAGVSNYSNVSSVDSRHWFPATASHILAADRLRVHQRQLIVIEFLQSENRLLKERLFGKRIRFTDAERAFACTKSEGG
jgi:hypothetical protein